MTELEKAAKLVIDARISRGWSQIQLAAAADVGLSTVQKIEQGRAPLAGPRTMQKLALAFEKHYDAKRIAFVDGRPAPGAESATAGKPYRSVGVLQKVGAGGRVTSADNGEDKPDRVLARLLTRGDSAVIDAVRRALKRDGVTVDPETVAGMLRNVVRPELRESE